MPKNRVSQEKLHHLVRIKLYRYRIDIYAILEANASTHGIHATVHVINAPIACHPSVADASTRTAHLVHAAFRQPMLLQHPIQATLQWLMLLQHIIH